MKAIQVTEYGDSTVLKFREIETPSAGPGKVRVQIKAAGLNFIDIYQRRGELATPLPYVPGFEASGVVESVGRDVTEFKVGDRVAYNGNLGSYSELNIVDADKLIPLPNDVTFEQGAAFPLQGLTAHYLVHEFHRVQKDETVLVHAAAGGMGLLLVQWLKHLGARVIGTVSTEEKAEIASAAGADRVVIYSQHDFVAETKKFTDGKGADFIIDGVGKTTFAKNLEAAKLRGHITLYGMASGPADPLLPNALQKKSLTISGGSLFNFILTRKELLVRAHDVLTAISEGWLKLRIENLIPLAQASEAHRILEGRNSTGKLLLKA